MNVKELAERAKSQLAELTGLRSVTISEVFKDEQGWHVFVDMLEMSRIPMATDVLGNYEALLDDSGNMLRFERGGSRLRGETKMKEAKA